jgi:hypothetical protein
MVMTNSIIHFKGDYKHGRLHGVAPFRRGVVDRTKACATVEPPHASCLLVTEVGRNLDYCVKRVGIQLWVRPLQEVEDVEGARPSAAAKLDNVEPIVGPKSQLRSSAQNPLSNSVGVMWLE